MISDFLKKYSLHNCELITNIIVYIIMSFSEKHSLYICKLIQLYDNKNFVNSLYYHN